MTDLVIWILVNFGISNGIANSSLFAEIRYWIIHKFNIHIPRFFTCVMCLGFWTPLLPSLLWYSPTGVIILDMFLGSASAWILYLCIMKRQNKT